MILNTKLNHYDKSRGRPWKKGKALYFSTFTALFSQPLEQKALHFHFALGPTNYIVSPACT